MIEELDLACKMQIALFVDVEITTDDSVDWFIPLENNIDDLEKSHSTTRSELEISKEFSKSLITFRH